MYYFRLSSAIASRTGDCNPTNQFNETKSYQLYKFDVFSSDHFLCIFIQGVKHSYVIITVFLLTMFVTDQLLSRFFLSFSTVFPWTLILFNHCLTLQFLLLLMETNQNVILKTDSSLDFVPFWCRSRLSVFCRDFWQRFFRL